MPRLQESKNRYSITIPKEIIAIKKWKKRDLLILQLNEFDRIELRHVDE